MTAGLAVHISRLNDSLAFEFSRGISFDFFVVSNADEFVFWELKQVSLQPAPIIDAAMFGAQFPSEMQSQIREAVRDIAIIHNDSEGPVINRIVFGEVPVGYREIVGATPLQVGEEYCVFVWGDGYEATREYFVG